MRADFRIANAVERVEGPLVFLKRTVNVGLNEALYVIGRDGVQRLGRVATLDEDSVIVEVLEKTAGLGVQDTVISMLGEPVCFDVGPNMLGRVFNSVGRPLDGDTPIPAMQRMRIDGMTINPARRALPRDFIETGVTAIDLMNSLVRGQKLPLLRDSDSGEFAVVFVGIGVSHDVAESFRSAMESSGALGHTVMFLNRADESSAQRLLAPRFALTAAEYLAFVENRHVLVIMTDMTNYCEALREVSASHGEIPGRKGFPGYMYSDLASLFERAGCLHGYDGTLTQLPILYSRCRGTTSGTRSPISRATSRKGRSCSTVNWTAVPSIRLSTCCRACRGSWITVRAKASRTRIIRPLRASCSQPMQTRAGFGCWRA
jgi:V/A-type H+-transporting ATPase subunit B